ncbi:MAG: LapA family protein [Crocosphaera sp.]|nr:LapA family protein [Crocosphaera sp.]
MRLIVLVLMLVGTVLILLQNQQPIILYFLGTDAKTAMFSLKLPLGIWVIGFTLVGTITSLLIQLLTRSPRFTTPRQSSNRHPQPQPSPEPPYERPEPKQSDWESPPPREWENTVQEEENDDEWDIEEPPMEQTIPQATPNLEETRSEFEVQQPPKTSSREGTVYSYTYRELSDRPKSDPPQDSPVVEKKSSPNDQVYEAKYRVITPPYRPSPDADDDEDESWI